MANRRKKRNQKSFKITFVKILGFLMALGAVIFIFGSTDENIDEDRYENVSTKTIEEYKAIRGTRENAITRSSTVINDLTAMNLDPDLFVRFPTRPVNRPDMRVVAMGEYHFHINGSEYYRKFIYLHFPFTFDNSIVNEHLRFSLYFLSGPNEQRLTFDTRANENLDNPQTSFGYGMRFIKSNRARGLWVLELQRNFNPSLDQRQTRIYSIDRMNRLGSLISRNDQTTYLGDGVTMPFVATYDAIEDDQDQIEFEFNSHVFITDNMSVEVAPTRVPNREGHMWVQGANDLWGLWRDVYYRPQLWFFNFNTTVDIDKIHNIRIYHQYRTRYQRQTWGGIGNIQVTYSPWRDARDGSGNIGRTIINEETGLHFMPGSDVRFNAITTPANARFDANEFDEFNINRDNFDRFEHSVLFHQAFARDESRLLGNNNNSRGQVNTQSIDVTTMDFETNGRMYRARVDITQDTDQGGYTPDPEHPGIDDVGSGIGDFIRNIPNHIGDFFGWIGTTINSALTNLFDGLGPEGTALVIIALIIKIILVIVAIRVALPIFIRTKTGGKAG